MQIITNQFQKELKKHGSDAFPILVCDERLSRYESGSFMWHWHPEIELTLIQKGRMLYKVNHCEFHLKEGDVLFGNANTLHAGTMENLQDCRYVSVTFSAKLIYGFYRSAVYTQYVEPVIKNFGLPAIHMDGSELWHEKFKAGVESIIRLERERPAFYEMDMLMELQALWKLLLENLPPEREFSSQVKAEYDRIRAILSYIEQNYSGKLSLKEIAEHIHLCESECSRVFKRYMKTSLFSFLQEYRIERSLEYLNRNESISEIAHKVGFGDSNYYSKVFTKIKGCSPREYRKNSLHGMQRKEGRKESDNKT